MHPVESDWKKFSAMLPIWRERYLADRNARIVGLLTDAKKSETDRFLVFSAFFAANGSMQQ